MYVQTYHAIHTCIYAHTYVGRLQASLVCLFVHMYACTYAYMHVNTRRHLHTYIFCLIIMSYVHAYIYITYIYILQALSAASIFVFFFSPMSMFCMYVYMYVNTYTYFRRCQRLSFALAPILADAHFDGKKHATCGQGHVCVCSCGSFCIKNHSKCEC
jgi:hypothetical protein